MATIKEKAHEIGWEYSKHYDPVACKQEWCEMAAREGANYVLEQIEQALTPQKCLTDIGIDVSPEALVKTALQTIEELKKIMATIKSYTDLEQSKKLAEILPLESADMHYCLEKRDVVTAYEIGITPFIKAKGFEGKCNVVDVKPAWSLAALFNILPKYIGDYSKCLYYDNGMYYCGYMDDGNFMLTIQETKADNPVDACYEMIIKLYELNLL